MSDAAEGSSPAAPIPPDPAVPSSPAGTRPAAAPASAAGTPLHRERLLPGIGTWIVIVAVGAMCGVVLVPLGATLALVVGLVGIVVAVVLGVLTAPVVEVSGGRLRAGRAQIEVGLLGTPEELEGEDWQRTMGVGFEPLAFHLTRGWIRSGLRAEVLDEGDPTTAWVLSTRRPEDLALALRSA